MRIRRIFGQAAAATAAVGVVGVFIAQRLSAQSGTETAHELIRFLSYQSDRPDKHGTVRGEWLSFSCGQINGEDRDNRAVANSLVKLGVSAIPEIEVAIASLSEEGRKSEFALNSAWLLLAYARIRGPAAYPALRSMMESARVPFLATSLDNSAALSLGLTSYVSGSRPLGQSSRCSPAQPRDALDQLALAWELNDPLWIEKSLGPSAKSALSALEAGRTWAATRTELWSAGPGDRASIGYVLNVPGIWGEPPETLTELANGSFTPGPANPELETFFKDASGADCGKTRIKFLGDGRTPFQPYLVDNLDLRDLLRLIGACAAQGK